jgi:hypothetical protein
LAFSLAFVKLFKRKNIMTKDEFLEIKEELKNEIKTMAAHQVENRKYGYQRDWACAAEITALLNYYHEHRGSEYRHGIEGHKLRGVDYKYARKMKALREKYDLIPVI